MVTNNACYDIISSMNCSVNFVLTIPTHAPVAAIGIGSDDVISGTYISQSHIRKLADENFFSINAR